MAHQAKVDSVDALKAFRIALIKFAEVCSTALVDAEGEMHRVMGWLERDQANYWQSQLRKRAEYVTRCKEAVRMKKLFKGPDGRPASAVDEEKALAVALKRFAEGEQKAKAVTAYSRKLPKEILMYKGQVQRFSTSLQSEVPFAASTLGQLITTLEAYVALSASSGAGGADGGPLITSDMAGVQSMGRSEGFTADKGWEALRAQVPAGTIRSTAAEAPAGGPPPLTTPELNASERERIASLPGPRDALDPESRVVLAQGAMRSNRVFLARTEISFPGDSGWYAGSTEPGAATSTDAATLTALRLTDLLAARADLKELLVLPPGYLIVLDGGGVSALLDPVDRDLWKTAEPAVLAAPAAQVSAAMSPPATAVP